jgi:hypothetical protein
MWDGVGSSWMYRKSKCHSLGTRPEGALAFRGRALNDLTRLKDIFEYAQFGRTTRIRVLRNLTRDQMNEGVMMSFNLK